MDGIRILLIDDDVWLQRLLGAKLRSLGIGLSCAGAGREGLAMARETEPSVILLDLGLPGGDGFWVLNQLKEDPATASVPVIVLTGSRSSVDKQRAFESSAVDYVEKPFDFTELTARIRNAHRTYRLMMLLAQRGQIDGLTGLWNRSHFDRVLNAQLEASLRTGAELSLVMIDLDHFKRVNDRWGHVAGDRVLTSFGRVLQEETRAYDTGCRYGGEEFGLVLGSTGAQEACRLCERIGRSISEERWAEFPGLRVTASFGVTDRSSGAVGSSLAWVQAADRALYSAKAAGRSCVRVYDARSGGGVAPVRLAG